VNRTILSSALGRFWIVGGVLVGGALLFGIAGVGGVWLPAALVVAGALAWVGSNAVAGAGDRSGGSSAGATSGDGALEALKEQYAAGEIDDQEFERRVETLLETEPAEDEGGSGAGGARPATDGGSSRGSDRTVDATRSEERPPARGPGHSRKGCRHGRTRGRGRR
jgi:uncharacterized membrane protein